MPILHPTLSPLFVAELFDAILDRLAEPGHYGPSYHEHGIQIRAPDPEGQRALAALARTCRGFSEPSLNHLWRRLNSLEPLFRCYSPRGAGLSTRQGLRPPSQADWAVINRYSHRIQELEVRNDCSCDFLRCAIFESHLLPNLKVLKWKTRANLNPIGIAYIQPLLVPGLVVLDVGTTEHDIALASFLKTCPSRCPGLTTIRFYIHACGREMIDIFSLALGGFKNLKCLTLEAPVNDTALRQLLMSSDLQELTLRFRGISLPPSDIPLRNVKKLDLTLDDLYAITQLLRPGHQGLREITLRLRQPEYAATIGSLFSGLASHPDKPPLQSLHLDSTLHCHLNDYRLFVLSFDTFRPLTFLTNLRELTIRLENPIDLSDEELADLVHNWPLLQVIELCYGRWFQAKHITFKGLLSLVTICPKLRAIGLTLDGRNVPSGVPVELGCNTITTLRFPSSPIDNPRLVAKFLLTYFPSATSTGIPGTNKWGVGGTFDGHGDSKWAEVGGYLANASKLDSTKLGVDGS